MASHDATTPDPIAIRAIDDAKSAFLLSGAFALAAAATVPGLLPSLPPEAQSLPLPLPLFCAVLAVQMTAIYGVVAFAGFRLALRRGADPSSLLTACWTQLSPATRRERFVVAFGTGLCCGLLVAAVNAIQSLFPETLPHTLHPPGIAVAMLASLAGAIGEEILFRLFALSLLLWLLPRATRSAACAILISALAFGAADAPAFILLFGGWTSVPPLAWLWLIALIGACGIAYGIAFLRWGFSARLRCIWAPPRFDTPLVN